MSTIGWVIYNGNLPSSKFVDFARMLQEAAHRQNGKLHIYKNNDLLSFLVSNEFKILKNTPESLPDYVIFIDKDIYLARQLESLGILYSTVRGLLRLATTKFSRIRNW